MTGKDRLIVALDVDTMARAAELVDILSPEVDIFKVGIAPFTDFGDGLLEKISKAGKKVFLDLKFHDIPNTVRNAAKAAAKKGVFMMNFHCLGGKDMLLAAARGAAEGVVPGGKRPILLGVTILTSMDDATMNALGIQGAVRDKVAEFASLAKEAGLDGVVASAREARMIKEKAGEKCMVVTPGVRPAWASSDDQKRVVTPKQAMDAGADYIVVGRPIIGADDPAGAARKIIEEMTR